MGSGRVVIQPLLDKLAEPSFRTNAKKTRRVHAQSQKVR